MVITATGNQSNSYDIDSETRKHHQPNSERAEGWWPGSTGRDTTEQRAPGHVPENGRGFRGRGTGASTHRHSLPLASPSEFLESNRGK